MAPLQRPLSMWKFVAPELVFGTNARHLAGRYARNLALQRVLVVTDPGVTAAGWTGQVIANLEREGTACSTFSHSPNPRAEEVMAGGELYERDRCDGIVAVGGGSAIDCAKGVGIVTSNRQHILAFEGVDEVRTPGPPLICVPTTNSGACVSQFAVITDQSKKSKISIVSKALVPDVSLIDPATTSTLSLDSTACTGIDSFAQAVEAFVSTSHSPVTDLFALEAIRLIAESLPRVITNPGNVEARADQMLGSLHGALAFSNASLGAVHAMSHALGGVSDLAHGECVAMLLAPVVAFNFDAAPERYRRIAEAMGLEVGATSPGSQRRALVEEVTRLRSVVGLDRTLGQIGVRSSNIPELAARAMRDPCIVTNPRRPSQKDIEALFEEAL